MKRLVVVLAVAEAVSFPRILLLGVGMCRGQGLPTGLFDDDMLVSELRLL